MSVSYAVLRIQDTLRIANFNIETIVYICAYMDNFSILTSTLLSWLTTRVSAPVVYAREEHSGQLRTAPHPYVEFIYATHGHFRLHVGQLTAQVQKGDIAMVNAHFGNHADFPLSGGRYECISFAIDNSRELAGMYRDPLLEIRRIADTAQVHESYGRVIGQYAAPATALRAHRLKAEAMLWLATVIDQLVGSGVRISGDASRVERVVAHAQHHYAQPSLGLSELARVAGVSPTHLCRIFGRRTGVSPARYIEQVRLARAADLLSRTDLSIKQVAYTVGYTDQLHFSRVFRTRMGKSPSLFRVGVV